MHTTAALVFTTVFAALYTAHLVGDHWVQSTAQSLAKGRPGAVGRWACTRHVLTLTATKALVLAPVALVLDLPLTVAGLALGLGLDALSHWWCDRRFTLERLARLVGRSEFYALGTGAHPLHPVTAKGEPAAHMGMGSYQLDQSFHVLFLLAASLIIATV